MYAYLTFFSILFAMFLTLPLVSFYYWVLYGQYCWHWCLVISERKWDVLNLHKRKGSWSLLLDRNSICHSKVCERLLVFVPCITLKTANCHEVFGNLQEAGREIKIKSPPPHTPGGFLEHRKRFTLKGKKGTLTS
jgi:hypothetical protein